MLTIRPGGALPFSNAEDLVWYNRKKALLVIKGPSKFGRKFFNASSAEVSSNGWTLTYPAAWIMMDGNASNWAICGKTSLTEASEVISHSKKKTLSGVSLPNTRFRVSFTLEASKGAYKSARVAPNSRRRNAVTDPNPPVQVSKRGLTGRGSQHTDSSSNDCESSSISHDVRSL